VHILDAQNSVSGLHELQEIALKYSMKRATAMPQAQSALRGWTRTDGVPSIQWLSSAVEGFQSDFPTNSIRKG